VSVFRVKFPQASSPNVHVNIPSRTTQAPVGKAIWAIGGGKGGIGKTLLASNMGVYLSWLNRRVVIVDMDLGGSNLHTSLGVDPPPKTLSDILTGRVENISDLIQPTPIRNVSIISGAQDPMGITNLRPIQKSRLLRKLREIDADNLILDLGAGTSPATLDFFLMADKKIILVTPEPTSIENAYRFIKLAFYRMLRAGSAAPHVRTLIETAMDLKNNRGIRSPKDLLAEVARVSPSEGTALQTLMAAFRIALIVNQVRVKAESDIGKSVQMVCEKYFGMGVDYVGYLPYDNSVWQSVRKRRPFLMDAPNSTAVTHLEEILRNLLKGQQARTG
jgi:flagellar biosynthesis protein FlhG